jgi:hypothetical protein
VTFVDWTQFIPEAERLAFVTDVLDHYRIVATDQPGEEKILSDGCHAFTRNVRLTYAELPAGDRRRTLSKSTDAIVTTDRGSCRGFAGADP